MTSRWCLKNLADEELVPGLERWNGDGRYCEAMVIAHVGEIERRKLYVGRGYQSMHDYVVRQLNFSSAAAFNRIAVARKALEYPRILDMIAAGELHVSGAKVLVPVLNDDNVDRLLDAAARQTKRRIEEIVAAERPRPDVATSIREVSETGAESLVPGPVASAPPRDPAPKYARVEALAPRRYALALTMSEEMFEKLQHARDLERHAVPDGDVATILERALDLLIEKSMKRQFAVTDKPRKGKDQDLSAEDGVPAETRRTVGARDEYRCTFVSEDGTRCNARAWAQLDHEHILKSQGGLPIEGNLRILCGPHNRFEAERKLGTWVREIPDKKRRARKPKAQPPVETGVFAEARAALVSSGYKDKEARAALELVRGKVDADATLEVVLRQAFCAITPSRCGEPQAIWRGGGDRPRTTAVTPPS